MNHVKTFLIAFWNYLFHYVLMRIPFHRIRLFFARMQLKKIGTGSSILLHCEFRKGNNIEIGNYTIINQRVLLDGRGGRLIIGNNVDIAQETNIWTLEHDVHSDFHASQGGDVIIEDYVWIASRATILPGITIGRGAVVACNSVVTRNVAPLSIVAGIPAKEIGQRRSNLTYQLNYRPWFR